MVGGPLLAFWRRHWFLRLFVRRAIAAVILCIGITLVAFVLTHVIPGNPAAANLGIKGIADPARVQAYNAEYGLDKPLPVQYELYLSHLLHLDLGVSQVTHRPVLTDLEQYVPASFELAVLAMTIAIAVGVPLGLVAATHKDSALDQTISLVTLTGLSMPPFWVGLIAIYVFSFVLGIAPGSGRLSPGAVPPPTITHLYTVDALLAGDLGTFLDALHHLILPALVLAVGGIGVLMRFTRSAVLEVLQSDYIVAARAKGLSSGRILLRYTLRAALSPVLTLSGLMLADLMAGAVLVESVFAYPGVGLYAARSALDLDLPAITGVCLFVAVVYVVINLAVDLLHAWIDPRVRAS
jgi:peptide/nickel transport system permease protein